MPGNPGLQRPSRSGTCASRDAGNGCVMRSMRAAGEIRAFAWVGIDQGLSALSNVVIAVAVTRAAGVGGLGRYSVAFACYLLVLGFQRQLVNEPLMSLRWQPAASNTVHDAPALGASLLCLLAASLVVLVVGLSTGRSELIVLAPLLPGVGIQDFYRYVAFRRQRQRLAAGLDGLWLLLSALSCYWILQSGSPTVAVVGWGVAGGIAAVFGAVQLRLTPARPLVSLQWWQCEARRLGAFLTLAGIAYTAGAQAMLLAIAAIIGEEPLGQLRQAQILLGPAALSITAFSFFVLPRLARRKEGTNSRASGLMAVAAATLALVASGSSLVIAAPVSRLVFGHAAAVSIALLVPLSLQLILEAGASGFVLPLQVAQRGAAIAAARTVSVVLGVPAVICAAILGGIVPAAWAFAAQAAIYLLAAWIGWARTQGSPTAAGSPPNVDHRPAHAERSGSL
jgi:O-antigen/teichoic acid export membrane protein